MNRRFANTRQPSDGCDEPVALFAVKVVYDTAGSDAVQRLLSGHGVLAAAAAVIAPQAPAGDALNPICLRRHHRMLAGDAALKGHSGADAKKFEAVDRTMTRQRRAVLCAQQTVSLQPQAAVPLLRRWAHTATDVATPLLCGALLPLLPPQAQQQHPLELQVLQHALTLATSVPLFSHLQRQRNVATLYLPSMPNTDQAFGVGDVRQWWECVCHYGIAMRGLMGGAVSAAWRTNWWELPQTCNAFFVFFGSLTCFSHCFAVCLCLCPLSVCMLVRGRCVFAALRNQPALSATRHPRLQQVCLYVRCPLVYTCAGCASHSTLLAACHATLNRRQSVSCVRQAQPTSDRRLFGDMWSDLQTLSQIIGRPGNMHAAALFVHACIVSLSVRSCLTISCLIVQLRTNRHGDLCAPQEHPTALRTTLRCTTEAERTQFETELAAALAPRLADPAATLRTVTQHLTDNSDMKRLVRLLDETDQPHPATAPPEHAVGWCLPLWCRRAVWSFDHFVQQVRASRHFSVLNSVLDALPVLEHTRRLPLLLRFAHRMRAHYERRVFRNDLVSVTLTVASQSLREQEAAASDQGTPAQRVRVSAVARRRQRQGGEDFQSFAEAFNALWPHVTNSSAVCMTILRTTPSLQTHSDHGRECGFSCRRRERGTLLRALLIWHRT